MKWVIALVALAACVTSGQVREHNHDTHNKGVN
jgi:hypothetical protein